MNHWRLFLAGTLWFLVLASASLAQGPEADWRTLETEHYRLHYTSPAAAWAQQAAAQIEEIYRRVAEEVGYAPAEITDVLVLDPLARANGAAWPILGWPRMVLWTSPPGPASVIGHYRDWGELLLTHEQAHLAHLLRPSRSPRRGALEKLLPIGPVARRSPRWLAEGYATYVEGRLTGYGRPHGDLRATILRCWAQAGELPRYSALDGDSAWLGMSMAYLMGSAFLEWLVERHGEDSLRQLWTRLAARHQRTFDEAFTGVFGDPPPRLYNRFRAELTYRAMVLERTLEASGQTRQGDLWQDLEWTTGPPAISPDGERLAIVLRSAQQPARLVVWSTQADTEAAEQRRRQAAELLAADPQDIVARPRYPAPRKPLFELVAGPGAAPFTPRWSGEGRSLIYVRYEADGRGVLHPDLYRWTLVTGQVERLTQAADLRDPDPAADGGWAVAVRRRHGKSQLVRVDLGSGGVEALFAATAAEVHDHPRLDPRGQRLAYIRHRQGAWQLVVRDLSSGVEQVLPTPQRATVAYPAWSADGHQLWASIGEGGFISIRSYDLSSGRLPVAAEVVVRGQGAALSPAPAADGRHLFYLDLQPHGLDLRRLALGPHRQRLAEKLDLPSQQLAPAIRSASYQTSPPRPVKVAADRPYGVGRIELLPLLGGRVTASESAWEGGLRWGDVVGRLDLLLLGSATDSAPAGGALMGAWRGWPLEVGWHLFDLSQRPSAQSDPVAERLDLDQQGVEINLVRQWRQGSATTGMRLFAHLGRVDPRAGDELSRQALGLRLSRRGRYGKGSWHWSESLDLALWQGRTAGEGWRRWDLAIEGGLERRRSGLGLKLGWRRGSIDDARFDIDRFQLGGLTSTLLPALGAATQIEQPALPAASLSGEQHQSQRLSISLGQWPVDLFWQRHRLSPRYGPRGAWLALWGAEIRWRSPPRPLLRLPALELWMGVAEVQSEPFAGRVEGWLGFGWRP